MPGAIAVLHTHNRRLDYHPHIHVIMPMAAANKKQGLWREKRGQYLFNHKALANVFRAKMLQGITEQKRPLPWQRVVDCQSVGQGKPAMSILGVTSIEVLSRKKIFLK